MLRAIVCLGLALGVSSADTSDLQRARTKAPRYTHKGDGQADLSKVLNRHLVKAEKGVVRACKEWSPVALQEFMARVGSQRSEDLQQVYIGTKDKRQMVMEKMDDYVRHWAKLNRIVDTHPHLLDPQRESHCREAVMWWTHHLTEEKRKEFRSDNLTVPLLPEGEKLPCGRGEGEDEHQVCLSIEQPNSCDWCHSTQKAHDAGVPGTSVPDALNPKFHGPDDGNPHGWDRKRRCDQDQMPRCQLCEGIGGYAWADKNSAISMTTCEVVATPEKVDNKTVHWPLYPKSFTINKVDGRPGYSDTLIGWKKDPFCFAFFPQNDSIPTLCYRSQDSTAKYYDISREATRSDYNVKLTGLFHIFPNITSQIMQVSWQMWIQNHLWVVDQCVCANPSGQHCTKPPCYSYVWHWDTFKSAQYLGRENIGVEWINNAGVGKYAKVMELDHFIMWSHHAWTDPKSGRIVRMWKPFNGLQNYDPAAWTDSVAEPDQVFEAPPPKCKKGGAPVRINCDDDGNYKGDAPPHGLHYLEALHAVALKMQQEGRELTQEDVKSEFDLHMQKSIVV